MIWLATTFQNLSARFQLLCSVVGQLRLSHSNWSPPNLLWSTQNVRNEQGCTHVCNSPLTFRPNQKAHLALEFSFQWEEFGESGRLFHGLCPARIQPQQPQQQLLLRLAFAPLPRGASPGNSAYFQETKRRHGALQVTPGFSKEWHRRKQTLALHSSLESWKTHRLTQNLAGMLPGFVIALSPRQHSFQIRRAQEPGPKYRFHGHWRRAQKSIYAYKHID